MEVLGKGDGGVGGVGVEEWKVSEVARLLGLWGLGGFRKLALRLLIAVLGTKTQD